MKHKHFTVSMGILAGIIALGAAGGACAQTTNDDFTQANDTNAWKTFGGACLTAGDGTGSIPGCIGLPYYGAEIQVGGSLGYLGQNTKPASAAAGKPDPAGQGALRFTNGYPGGYVQAGAIISSGAPFSTGAGLQVIFKTVTYRGDSGGGGADGADGIGFFLMDGAHAPYDVGAFGGSLGYTCSNANNDPKLRADATPRGYDGLEYGYLGLGMDEYGNFLNQGDNTASGFGYVPGRIGLRGAGSITWRWLNANFPKYYPTSLNAASRASAVRDTCRTGFIWDYNRSTVNDEGDPITLPPAITTTPVLDYPAIYGAGGVGAFTVLGFKIANEAAITRSDGVPITYNLKITQNGLLSLYYSKGGANYVPVLVKQSITASNGPLPGSFRFGFTGSTGGSTNVHEILCFQAAPADQAGTSVGVNEKEASKIASGTQAYLAYYYPSTWTGRLTASDLLYNAVTQTLSISAVANWDASCNLTGVPASPSTCPTTGAPGPLPAQAPAGRTMLTWDGTQGIAFEWPPGTGSAITPAQQATLDLGDLPLPYTANRLNYLRGDRSNEITSLGVGAYRARDGVLGDIVNSSPTWVGPPGSPYSAMWKDLVVSGATAPENSGTQSYTQFLSAAQTRLNVVYNGANDGFLHGFRSGSFDSTGKYVTATTPNDGAEVLAYMPGAVLQSIHNAVDPTLDYSNPQYSHNFYVDATPDADELFYAGKWHTWLAGGLGAGGAAIYALDVTDPTQYSEANAKTLVQGEWTSASISCTNVAAIPGCGKSMGNTYGVPVIRRLHNGKWGVIFGNGFGSASGDAGIFIMVVNPTDGSIAATHYLSTGKVGANGIAYVSPADLDGDHITDYVYAGDLLGNVWRFDLTSGSESSWAASSTPLFTVSSAQPITTKLLLAITSQTGGPPRLMVDFGTGRKIPQTNTLPAQFANGAQQLYGIWDWDMTNWNLKTAKPLASLTGPQTVNDSTLQTQTLTATAGYPASGYLTVSSNPVCWAGSSTCAGGAGANTKFGFSVALLSTNEQVIFSPLLYQNAFIVNTTIPATNSPTSCQVNHDTGDTIAISVSTGGSLKGFFKNVTDTNAAGSLTNGTGTPFVALAGGNAFVITQSLGDGSRKGPLPCPKGALYCSGQTAQASAVGKRLTWIERR